MIFKNTERIEVANRTLTTATTADDLLTTKQSSQIVKVKPNTLAVWRMQNRHLRFLKVGSRVYYRRSELERFLRDGERGPEVDAR